MHEVFEIPLRRIQPSQLFINDGKLKAVLARLEGEPDAQIEPLPVKRLCEHIVYSDGHTRALVALMRREEVINVYWETDELDWDAYRACVQWCRERDIRTIVDLRHRVVPAGLYQTIWLDRCARLFNELGRGPQ